MSTTEKLSYATSRGDSDSESASIKVLISALSPFPHRKTGTPGAPVAHAGVFSGFIEFDDNILALCTGSAGSKLLLAAELNYYETVALDCMAMNVNDLLCIDAEPLAFVDYTPALKLDQATWSSFGKGLSEAYRRVHVSLCGGDVSRDS